MFFHQYLLCKFVIIRISQKTSIIMSYKLITKERNKITKKQLQTHVFHCTNVLILLTKKNKKKKKLKNQRKKLDE